MLVVAFFVLVASLFPLGVGAEPQLLQRIGPGVIWVCALLAAFLSLPGLFAGDYADGTLEQMLLSPHPHAGLGRGQDRRPLGDHRDCRSRCSRRCSGLQYDLDRATARDRSRARSPSARRCCRCWARPARRSRWARAAAGCCWRSSRCRSSCRCWSSAPARPRRSLRALAPRPHLSLLGAGLILAAMGVAPGGVRRRAHRAGLTMNWFYFASPSTFYRLAGRMRAVVLRAGRGPRRGGPLRRPRASRPPTPQQGEVYRIIFIHVPAAWMSMFLYFVMACYGGGVAHLQHAALGDDGPRDRADGRDVHLRGAVDGLLLGPAHLGRLLGVGRAPHLGARAALPVLRLHRARQRVRGPAPRRPRRARCSR